MKFFGVIVLLAVAASCQAEAHARSKRSSINDNLVAMVESLRESMKTGNESLGIPVLEPYHADSLEIAVDQTLATLDGTLTNLTVNGLTEFVIDTLTFSVIGMKFTFGFTFPLLNATSGYSIDGLVSSLLPVYGTGDFNVALQNLTISGVAQISANNSYLYMRSLTTAVTLEDFKFVADGILGDNELSALLSAVLTDLVPEVLVNYQDTITSVINAAVIEIADGYLGTMTLSELLALLRG